MNVNFKMALGEQVFLMFPTASEDVCYYLITAICSGIAEGYLFTDNILVQRACESLNIKCDSETIRQLLN